MITGSATTRIDQPVEVVFDLVVGGFARNYPRWSPEVRRLEVLTDGPLQVGSRVRQVRVDEGHRSDTTFRVNELEPPRHVAFAELSGRYAIVFTLSGSDGRSELAFEFRLHRLELYMRPFERLIRRAVQAGAERTVHNIKHLAEQEGAARASRSA